jgi:hypothetical protein
MCVEAFFCLVPPCGIVSFSSKEKESRKKEITYPLANLVAVQGRFLLNDPILFYFDF